VTGERRDRAAEHVEMISSDPDLFGDEPASTPLAQRRRRPALVALVAAACTAVVAVAAVSSQTPGSAPSTSVPSTTVPSTTVPGPVVAVPSTLPGRDAPVAASNLGFVLRVEPSAVAIGAPVTVRLEGDLSGVASPLAAVAWVDERLSGRWRTVYWMARSPGPSQKGGAVSPDPLGPGPDAVTFDARQAVDFDVAVLAAGSYRMCRYVPLHAGGAAAAASNPAYVCAALTVHDT
jgi:hypothetical protein